MRDYIHCREVDRYSNGLCTYSNTSNKKNKSVFSTWDTKEKRDPFYLQAFCNVRDKRESENLSIIYPALEIV